MGITNLYITRHGQTEWNVQGRLQGHLDSPLTELGVIQAEQLADSLVNVEFDVIYSSPSLRTVRTAEMIRGERPIDITIEDKLREINMGSWEGMELAEVKLQYPREHEAYWNTPDLYVPSNGGETFEAVSQRAVSCIEKIIRDNENKTIMLVTHTVTLKSIMNYFEKRPLKELWNPPYVHPTSLSHVMIEDGIVTIEKYGDMAHIDG
ncbi:histidine phosphatase family protein [Alicyclobacillus fodiniaquatilis]|uniref:Histidine phosphatase family protein n=1 Tax=Alicyclobacillus fodiniaquatilis TaxID=1661150 RepID=A0ABW4JF35_9BACL